MQTVKARGNIQNVTLGKSEARGAKSSALGPGRDGVEVLVQAARRWETVWICISSWAGLQAHPEETPQARRVGGRVGGSFHLCLGALFFPLLPGSSTAHLLLWPLGPFLFLCCSQLPFLLWLLGVACGILAPRPGIKPVPSAVEVRSLNHWTARGVPPTSFLIQDPERSPSAERAALTSHPLFGSHPGCPSSAT